MAGAFNRWLESLATNRTFPQGAGRQGRPRVTLSYAQSLDGSLALERGRSTAISGPDAMALTHRLRAAHDALLVGIGTVLADDPQLTVRLATGSSPQPVILDTRLRLPVGCRLLQREGCRPWVFAMERDGDLASVEKAAGLEAAGARVFRVRRDPSGGLALTEVLDRLGALGISMLMVEGGARIITSFLAQRLYDYAVVTVAPVWLGGLPSVEGPVRNEDRVPSSLSRYPALLDPDWEQVGEDMVVWGRRGERVLP